MVFNKGYTYHISNSYKSKKPVNIKMLKLNQEMQIKIVVRKFW